MAKLNAGVLRDQLHQRNWELHCAKQQIKFQELLRRIENLTECNFEEFIDREVVGFILRNDGFYFPVAESITQSGQGIGKFASQWG
ncbi:hypothetical protein SCRM01_180 [Synechococcus phage S-CRM01]|uniref:hypothetical protein n=1 Tax=Synechococcus phage S-CRM01 TaxID=1026955 RepID=UPI000209E405|nr:hypothetical protein SCRM01_180 [Synechococcus phage S-CRM01]AEC53126.1 hypothetical protein SCRM01_180 [Synechococcus phage S-CRM01]